MLVIIVILLFFGVVVRHKWKNAVAKTEEILKLVAQEEAEIAKLQCAEDRCSMINVVNPTLVVMSQAEKNYYCAVCYCPSTTRCSQCKAVRYCSGKCQIIHWRQGHKEQCRPCNALSASNEGGSVVGRAKGNQLAMNLETETSSCSGICEEHDNSGSSSGSSNCLSPTERSEATLFAPNSPDKETDGSVDSHILETSSDSGDAEVRSSFPSVSPDRIPPLDDNVRKVSTLRIDERLDSKSYKAKRKENGPSEEFVLGRAELGRLHISASVRTYLAEDQRDQALLSTSNAMKYMPVRDSRGQQLQNAKLIPHLSNSLKMRSSDEFRNNESEVYRVRGLNPVISGSSENHLNASRITEINPTIETGGGRDIPMLAPRGMKTSVHHCTAPKQSETFTPGLQKESGENYKQEAIFPLKLFMQLYSCHDVSFRPFGLVNCGNSCYANAVLQCLIFTHPLTSYLLQGLHSRKCHKRGWCFICKLEYLILMGQQMKTPPSPVGLLSQIQTIGKEEDAHEFLRNVVDKMQSISLEEAGASDSLAEDSTLVGLSFGGYLRSKIKCMRCSRRSERSDRMMDLTVEIDGNIYTLEEALERFTKSETLGGDDKYKCSRCKSYEKAKKKLTVSEAPNILTIVLKRFQSGSSDKLNKKVRFSEILNLAPFMSGTSDRYPLYHLYAVVVHMGVMNAADTGHYVSYVKDFRGDWFRIDDSRVCPVDLNTVLSVEAYILFYARLVLIYDLKFLQIFFCLLFILSGRNCCWFAVRDTPRVPSFITKASSYSDGKTGRRLVEAISLSNGERIHGSETNPHWMMSPNDFDILHRRGNPIADSSSSDSSSIFSVSDTGSYST